MLRYPAILLALLAALGSASPVQSQESPRQDSNSAEQRSGAKDASARPSAAVVIEEKTKEAEKKTGPHADERKDGWFNGWGLSDKIALFASIFAFLQVLALMATLAIMRSTAHRQLRAYVCDVAGTATFVSSSESRIEIDIQFRNAGQTPAYDVRISCANPIIGRPIDRPYEKPSPFAPIRSIIGPGRTFSVQRLITQVSGEQLRQIQNGERVIWIWGRVDYVDAFKSARYLEFQCLALGSGQSWKLLPAPDGYKAN
jgi:hypothetical protein